MDEDAYKGDIALVNRSDGRHFIQLVNQDAVNLAMEFPDEGTAEREVEDGFFAIGRGPTCRVVVSDPSFQVTPRGPS